MTRISVALHRDIEIEITLHLVIDSENVLYPAPPNVPSMRAKTIDEFLRWMRLEQGTIKMDSRHQQEIQDVFGNRKCLE